MRGMITSLEQIRAWKMLHAGLSRGHWQNLIAESADMEALFMGNGLHPHWTLRKLCKDQSVLDVWLHHPSFLMASHVLLLFCSTFSNTQSVIRVFSGDSQKLIKVAAEKTARVWHFWSCIDAQTELESTVVMLVSIQFDRSGGSP